MTTGANPMSQEVLTKERVDDMALSIPTCAEMFILCASHEALRADAKFWRDKVDRFVEKAETWRQSMYALEKRVIELTQRAEAAEAESALHQKAAQALVDEWDVKFTCVCGRTGHYVEADTVDAVCESTKKAGSAFLARHKRILSELHNQHLYHKAMLEAVASEKFLAEAAECHRVQIAAIELALREEA